MNLKIKFIIVFFISLLIFEEGLYSHARESPGLKKLNFGYSALTGSQSIPWVAKESGIFEKFGLNVQLIYLAGGSLVAQALVSREVPIAQFGGYEAIQLNLAGADVVIIGSNLSTMDFYLITLPEIKRIDDLRGKKIGVGRFGGGPDFAIRFALNKWGLIPDKDVAIIQIGGGQPGRVTALSAKAIDGTVVNPPSTLVARKLGLHILSEISSVITHYPQTSINTTKQFINKDIETVRSYIKAHISAIKYMKTYKDETMRIIAMYTKTRDMETVEETYNHYVLKLIKPDIYTDPRGVQFILDQLGDKFPKAKTAKVEQFLDLRFIKELMETGFIEGLYKK